MIDALPENQPIERVDAPDDEMMSPAFLVSKGVSVAYGNTLNDGAYFGFLVRLNPKRKVTDSPGNTNFEMVFENRRGRNPSLTVKSYHKDLSAMDLPRIRPHFFEIYRILCEDQRFSNPYNITCYQVKARLTGLLRGESVGPVQTASFIHWAAPATFNIGSSIDENREPVLSLYKPSVISRDGKENAPQLEEEKKG